MRICIVEDDEKCLQATQKLLTRALKDADIVTATDATSALSEFNSAADSGRLFDALIIDLKIPAEARGPDGIRYDVTQKAASLFPNATVVLYTAYAKGSTTKLDKLTESGRVTLIEKTAAGHARTLVELLRNRHNERVEAELMGSVDRLLPIREVGHPSRARPRSPTAAPPRSLAIEYNSLVADIMRHYDVLSSGARQRIEQALGLTKEGGQFIMRDLG